MILLESNLLFKYILNNFRVLVLYPTVEKERKIIFTTIVFLEFMDFFNKKIKKYIRWMTT